jgi:thiamine-monophosphate kinase
MKKLTDLGESRIIGNLAKELDIGDDAACLKMGDGFLVLTTDMIFGPTHIPDQMSWEQIGRYIVSINLSDIAAMGAKPVAFLVSYGSPDIAVDDFETLIGGVKKQCSKYETKYAGGDMNETDELTLAGFAIGKTNRPVLRSQAKVDDVVAVTGNPGATNLGIGILTGQYKARIKDLKPVEDVARRALEPEPRIKEGIALGELANSMMDISDSLSINLHEIARMSGVRIEVDLEKIPMDENALKVASELNVDAVENALYGAGDYELLFTMPESEFKRVGDSVGATAIGKVVEGSGVSSAEGEIERRGYEHFSRD